MPVVLHSDTAPKKKTKTPQVKPKPPVKKALVKPQKVCNIFIMKAIAVLCYKAVKLQQPSYLYSYLSLLVGSHAASPPSGTVFPHLYALLTVTLVLGLSSRLTCSQDICSRSAVRASDIFTGSFGRCKFVTYLPRSLQRHLSTPL